MKCYKCGKQAQGSISREFINKDKAILSTQHYCKHHYGEEMLRFLEDNQKKIGVS